MGSSPLTRGKPNAPAAANVLERLIPAHAGKTIKTGARPAWAGAHPRSRGENDGGFAWRANFPGSSPLTRGKRCARKCDQVMGGLIPAHAGKTATSTMRKRRLPAHPRSRGENSDPAYGRALSMGSSPLTRGKHFLTCAFTAQIGQILESLELCASSESYSSPDAYATDAP